MLRNTIQCLLMGAALWCGLVGIAQAQDCGCSGTAEAGCGDGYCDSGSSFIGKLRAQMNCDPAKRTGLWDGYCQERKACDHIDTHSHGWGFGHLGRGFALPVGLGACGGSCGTACGDCGSTSCGGSCGGGCATGCGTGCGGSCFTPGFSCNSCGTGGSLFGGSCFRNDGHFFGAFRHHQWFAKADYGCEAPCEQPCEAPVPTCGCDNVPTKCGGLFSGRKLPSFKGLFHRGGCCGCGHFHGDCGTMSYEGCGCGS